VNGEGRARSPAPPQTRTDADQSEVISADSTRGADNVAGAPVLCPSCGSSCRWIAPVDGDPPFGPEFWDCEWCGHEWYTEPAPMTLEQAAEIADPYGDLDVPF